MLLTQFQSSKRPSAPQKPQKPPPAALSAALAMRLPQQVATRPKTFQPRMLSPSHLQSSQYICLPMSSLSHPNPDSGIRERYFQLEASFNVSLDHHDSPHLFWGQDPAMARNRHLT